MSLCLLIVVLTLQPITGQHPVHVDQAPLTLGR
jgi:hypothetical protein